MTRSLRAKPSRSSDQSGVGLRLEFTTKNLRLALLVEKLARRLAEQRRGVKSEADGATLERAANILHAVAVLLSRESDSELREMARSAMQVIKRAKIPSTLRVTSSRMERDTRVYTLSRPLVAADSPDHGLEQSLWSIFSSSPEVANAVRMLPMGSRVRATSHGSLTFDSTHAIHETPIVPPQDAPRSEALVELLGNLEHVLGSEILLSVRRDNGAGDLFISLLVMSPRSIKPVGFPRVGYPNQAVYRAVREAMRQLFRRPRFVSLDAGGSRQDLGEAAEYVLRAGYRALGVQTATINDWLSFKRKELKRRARTQA